MFNLCAPAFIYVIFSLTHIIIDTIKGLYNTAFFKFIVSILVTILLDALCKGGMGVISWLIVFIPFIFMTVIVTILLYVFGLDVATGQLDIKCINNNVQSDTTKIIIKDPTELPILRPPPDHEVTKTTTTVNAVPLPNTVNSYTLPPPKYSTDPAYQS
jgi:predicted membrane protein